MELLRWLVAKLKSLPTTIQVALCTIGCIVLVVLVGVYANSALHDFGNGTVNTDIGPASNGVSLTRVYDTLLRYDSNHYRNIIENGYTPNETAFFPLYPFIVKQITRLGITLNSALLITSWLFAVLAGIVYFRWVSLEIKLRELDISPWLPLGLLVIFPTSFFMALGYTESLFFFLTITSLLCYRTKNYVLAGIFLAFATATRVQGGVLVIYYLIDYLQTRNRKDWKKLLPVIMAPLGIVGYMLYLNQTFGNPLQFIAAQSHWGRFSGDVLANLSSSFTFLYFWFLPVLLGALYLIYRHLGVAWLVYSICFILVPLSSGRFDSINRYMLVIPPLFIALATYYQVAPRYVQNAYLISSSFLLAWSFLLFVNNYWVG